MPKICIVQNQFITKRRPQIRKLHHRVARWETPCETLEQIYIQYRHGGKRYILLSEEQEPEKGPEEGCSKLVTRYLLDFLGRILFSKQSAKDGERDDDGKRKGWRKRRGGRTRRGRCSKMETGGRSKRQTFNRKLSAETPRTGKLSVETISNNNQAVVRVRAVETLAAETIRSPTRRFRRRGKFLCL